MRLAFVSRAGVLAATVTLLAACGMFQKRETTISDIPKPVPEEGYEPSEQYGRVPLDDNAKVQSWINYFTGRGRKYMHTYLERSARYIPLMKATFRERGMPDELAYVAMIESGFSPHAFSHASAVGYWQFIRSTGKRYNLRIDDFVDERRDPILSTQAAANFLDSLYALFGDWHLALSAYNAGERRIQNAVMKRRTRNFWELTRIRRTLPAETANYVPKYIAAVMISSAPEKYGFTDIDFQPAFSFDTVVIEKPISLELLAKELNVDFEDMKRMNPRYRSDFVPIYADRVNAVRVPTGMKDFAVAVLEKVGATAPTRYVASFEYYRVRRGDTLSTIARRHRTSIAYLKDLNNIHRGTMIRIGQRLKIPDGGRPVARRTVSQIPRAATIATGNGVYHTVARGETLTSIAARYGTTISELRRLNNLGRRSVLRAGATLRVKADGSSATQDRRVQQAPARRVAAQPLRKKIHVVRRGENLSTIANKYRITVQQIAQANALRNRSKIFVGAQLLIP